jgi:hypothetical protein
MSVKDKHHLFDGHVIKIIQETEHAKVYEFRNPNSWEFWFKLVCADNLIAMTGDAYSLFIEPGYGRDGLAFLRGSVRSEGYFLGKCPHDFSSALTEFSREEALANFKSYLESGYVDEEEYVEMCDELSDEGELRDEVSYYDICSDYEIDEPSSPRVLTNRVKIQLAGLQKFVEAYDKLNPIPKDMGGTEIEIGDTVAMHGLIGEINHPDDEPIIGVVYSTSGMHGRPSEPMVWIKGKAAHHPQACLVIKKGM